MKLRNCFWIFCAFALSILLVSCPIEYVPRYGDRIATPAIQMTPNRPVFYGDDEIPRAFNAGTLAITLTSTPGATIYFTTNGTIPSATNGESFTMPINLIYRPGIEPRGRIVFQAIGIKEGHPDSAVARKEFQIFPRPTIPTPHPPSVTSEGIGYGGGRVEVTLTLAGGNITTVHFEDLDHRQTSIFWIMAMDHAREFFTTMNHWDFDVRTGATATSVAIRQAAQEALSGLLP